MTSKCQFQSLTRRHLDTHSSQPFTLPLINHDHNVIPPQWTLVFRTWFAPPDSCCVLRDALRNLQQKATLQSDDPRHVVWSHVLVSLAAISFCLDLCSATTCMCSPFCSVPACCQRHNTKRICPKECNVRQCQTNANNCGQTQGQFGQTHNVNWSNAVLCWINPI